MFNVLFLCREYGWQIEYVLGLPFKALASITTQTSRLVSIDRIEDLRIGIANGADKKYITDLMNFYSKNSASKQKKKQKSVNTAQAFDILRGKV